MTHIPTTIGTQRNARAKHSAHDFDPDTKCLESRIPEAKVSISLFLLTPFVAFCVSNHDDE